jgi:hypothetical protein
MPCRVQKGKVKRDELRGGRTGGGERRREEEKMYAGTGTGHCRQRREGENRLDWSGIREGTKEERSEKKAKFKPPKKRLKKMSFFQNFSHCYDLPLKATRCATLHTR